MPVTDHAYTYCWDGRFLSSGVHDVSAEKKSDCEEAHNDTIPYSDPSDPFIVGPRLDISVRLVRLRGKMKEPTQYLLSSEPVTLEGAWRPP
jgi:hypothetical protein